ncbi:hypothetical protein BGZ76_011623, partial [Entomortierella beljakovae]
MGILNSILSILPGRRMTPNFKTALSTVTESVGETSQEGNYVNCQDHSISTTTNAQQGPATSNIRFQDMDIPPIHSSPSPPSPTSTCSSSRPSLMAQFTFGTPASTAEIDTNKPETNIVVPFDKFAVPKVESEGAVGTISTATVTTTTPTAVTTESQYSAQARPHKRRLEGDTTTEVDPAAIAMDIDSDSSKTVNSNTEHNPENHHDGNQKYSLVQNRMFDIPEIIRSIGEFLDMPSLAACCLVSRIWATHCTPLMWKHVVDKHWLNGRFYALVRSKAPFIQTIKCKDKTDYEEMLLCDLPRLKALTFQGCRESMAVKVKILAKVQDTLTSLVLRNVGNIHYRETIKAIRNLKKLTTLKIVNASYQANQLEDVLSDCNGIEFLSLSSVRVTMRQPIGNDDFTPDEDIEFAPELIDNALHTIGTTRIRYLALKDMTAPVSYLSKIIKSSPQLLELSLAANENLAFTSEFFQSMKASCPNLYALDVGSCKQIYHDEFSTLFNSITQLTVINLSSTLVADRELLLLAENCHGLRRLEIKYCTHITSMGLHRFLCNSGPSLRHLQAEGVTLQPETFDNDHWKCSNLQILFVHIGLIFPPTLPASNKNAVGVDSNISSDNNDSNTDDCSGNIKSNITSELAPLGGVGNDKKRSQADIFSPQSSGSSSSSSSSSGAGHVDEALNSATSAVNEIPCPTLDKSTILVEPDGDIVMKHPLHPIQGVTNVQYLGLMGNGPNLTHSVQSLLIKGFQSIKRLHLMGLYQSFKKEDIVWLAENLPELCRIDAEKYHISDDLVKWAG